MTGSSDTARRDLLIGGLTPSRKMRVTDVGANPLGDAPYKGLLTSGACEVFGFEPNLEAFEKLQAVKSDAETYFPTAIGAPGERTLYLHPKSGFTSLFPLDSRALAFLGKGFWKNDRIQEIDVTTQNMDDIADLPGIDLLKMDLQGGEFEVLQGGGAKLSKAVAIVTEVRFHRMYEGEAVFGDLDVALRALGFKLHKLLFTKSIMLPHDEEKSVVRGRMTSQLLDGDAVYIRDADYSVDLNNDQRAYLAMAADSVFQSFDLALNCIGILAQRGAVAPDLAARYVAALPPRTLAENK